jgi:hypothetical protein
VGRWQPIAWGGAGRKLPFGVGIVLLTVVAERLEPATEGPGRAPERLDIPGVENVFRLTPWLYSGGDPRGTEGLAALQALGIRTIISVDGAVPNVEAARQLGMRYVHLPLGYDGVPRAQAVRLVKAVRTLPGPV